MRSILIVDDSPTIRRMISVSLQSVHPDSMLEAGNGLEAIEKLALEPVDLILLDMNMPEMNGVDLLRFLKLHKVYKDIPVIVLTTKDDEQVRREALACGAAAFLTKPFEPAALADHVESLLASRAP